MSLGQEENITEELKARTYSVWSVIAKRKKHKHTCWSKRGGNQLAKILAKKCSGKLYEVTKKLKRPVFVEEMYDEILMAGRVDKKVGKGYEYPATGHMVGLEGKIVGKRSVSQVLPLLLAV